VAPISHLRKVMLHRNSGWRIEACSRRC